MDLRNLITFKTILEEGSFQRAAQKLNYTQSTVSVQVQQLEQELQLKLFERIGRRMKLTDGGQQILPQVNQILEAADVIKNFGRPADDISGQLRVALPESFLCYQMQPTLRRFKEQAPQVRLTLRSGNCYGIRDSILSGETDIGVDYQLSGCSQSINIEPLCSYPLALVCSPQLESSLRDFVTPHQKKEVCLFAGSPDNLYRQMFEAYLFKKDIMLSDTVELWSVEARKKSVASNLGISFTPRFTVKEELRAGTLTELPVELPDASITAYCLYHKNKWLSPAMVLFLKLLRQSLEA